MKLAQAWDAFVVNYVTTIKPCQVNPFSHFVDLHIIFKFNMFYFFKSLMGSFIDLFIMFVDTRPKYRYGIINL